MLRTIGYMRSRVVDSRPACTPFASASLSTTLPVVAELNYRILIDADGDDATCSLIFLGTEMRYGTFVETASYRRGTRQAFFSSAIESTGGQSDDIVSAMVLERCHAVQCSHSGPTHISAKPGHLWGCERPPRALGRNDLKAA